MVVFDFLLWAAEPIFRLLDRFFPFSHPMLEALTEEEMELLRNKLGLLIETASLLGIRVPRHVKEMAERKRVKK